jgi:hypothetical protein
MIKQLNIAENRKKIPISDKKYLEKIPISYQEKKTEKKSRFPQNKSKNFLLPTKERKE